MGDDSTQGQPTSNGQRRRDPTSRRLDLISQAAQDEDGQREKPQQGCSREEETVQTRDARL